ncbi:hypothetical protein OQA88_13559 [Cercophora sp. LCS_1]
MGSSEKVDKAAKVDKKIKKDKSDKKEKKDKKRSESDGIHKESKDKKKDKTKKEKLTAALDAHLAQQEAAIDTSAPSSPKEDKATKTTDIPEEVKASDQELVYFAYPLADEKIEKKKILKLVKKCSKMKALFRGTKEVEKAIKRTPITTPGKNEKRESLLILAGDIFPCEVIEHFPLLAEEHHIPYLFVRSRVELGEAAGTKRATSVIMLKREPKKATDAKADDKIEEYHYMFDSMVEWALEEWQKQVYPWASGNHPTLLALKEAESA